ncbi:MAG: hypothetical protein DRG80_06610 [Deltaproteobacteria bacterium]|nr:MAG: hypothetical protein DRG80_06610 [Deltaproteobacteria bacterium]
MKGSTSKRKIKKFKRKMQIIVGIILGIATLVGGYAAIDYLWEKYKKGGAEEQKRIKLRQEKYLANLDTLLKANYGPFERLMFKQTFLEKWENLEKEVQTLSMIKMEKEELLSALHKEEYDNAEKTLISLQTGKLMSYQKLSTN